VNSLVFSPAGRRLASGSDDTSALVFDLFPRSAKPGKRALETLWSDLKSGEGHKALAAIWEWSATGKEGVAFLRERLKPPGPAWPERARRLIAQLDDDDPGFREEATRKLREKGFYSEPPLRKALEAEPSAEARIRIERLLAPLSKAFPIPKGEPLRRHRAIWALELIGTKEARGVLEMVVKESPSLRERNEAEGAFKRLEGR
jgi:hypothetical protein